MRAVRSCCRWFDASRIEPFRQRTADAATTERRRFAPIKSEADWQCQSAFCHHSILAAMKATTNDTLYFSDNLDVLREHLAAFTL
jgi:hypothetical protein